nr:hypothetical protein [Tanacetum cinerariifolium]
MLLNNSCLALIKLLVVRIKVHKLGLGALTGETTGSVIGELTGFKVRIRDLDWTTGGWTSLVLPLVKNPPSKHLVFEEPELDKQELGKLEVGKPRVDKQRLRLEIEFGQPKIGRV